VATPIEPPPFRWGAQPQDWTTYQETGVRPLYEGVFDRLGLTAGTCLLDVGCGAGLAAQLAASRGARVWGLDASAAMLEIARSRVPECLRSGGGRGIRTPKGLAARWISSPLPYQLRLALRAHRVAHLHTILG
jgi:trans-aconitate methyltransferase